MTHTNTSNADAAATTLRNNGDGSLPYDVVIIGAGMSGLAAGIRLAHFGKRVCILERHNAVGGLNGFYSVRGRQFDVGLHAMTNFVRAGVKGTALGKLLRQLRIDREELDLCEQGQSKVSFGPQGETELRFNNDFALFESEVARVFPGEIDNFRKLVERIKAHNEVALDARPMSARAVVGEYIQAPLLEEMIFCPLMYYGSATERDMDFGQFVIMFKAIFLEGLARPFDGVRVVLRVLLDHYRKAGGERRMKCGVKKIIVEKGSVSRLLLDDGSEMTARIVLSSVGAPETAALVEGADLYPRMEPPPSVGKLSYCETIMVLKKEPAELGIEKNVIIFFNDSERFHYEESRDLVDLRSGVICMPNNFLYGGDRRLEEGWLRCTCLAGKSWLDLPEEKYLEEKSRCFEAIQQSACRFLGGARRGDIERETVFTDMFTPRTITRYTGRMGGAIYGSPVKIRDGRTGVNNLYLCGTDQGFLGIVGAMLSGISMANLHALQNS